MMICCCCCAEGNVRGPYEAAAAAAMATSTYPMTVQSSTGPEPRQKSESFFGWLPGSGIMNKVIEKTKVITSYHSFIGWSAMLYSSCFNYSAHIYAGSEMPHCINLYSYKLLTLQCFDAVGWAAGRASSLHMAQLMPLLLTISCFSKIQIAFNFLVLADPGSPGQRPLTGVTVCVCVISCGLRNSITADISLVCLLLLLLLFI